MNQEKLDAIKNRAKSAFGLTQLQINKKKQEEKNKNKLRSKTSHKIRQKKEFENDYNPKYENNSNYNISYFQGSDRTMETGYKIDEYHPFILSSNSKNIIKKKKRKKKFNYKQTVNLQKLNDYIIYEYTKNKMEFNKINKKKTTTSFRLPIQYRRMGNHGKKEDLIPINNIPKINLEDILILHNSNTRNSMTQHKVKNFYFKNNVRYKKYKLNPHRNKEYSDEIALKYINIM